jgi:hypothetical protein
MSERTIPYMFADVFASRIAMLKHVAPGLGWR